MEATLLFGCDYLKIKNFEYHAKDTYYNTAFDLEVRSGVFCGQAPCEYNMQEFRGFVLELSEMYDLKRYTAHLNEIGYGSSVKFAADKIGHIEISGEIFGEARLHSLKFSFMADQTVIGQFITELRELVDSHYKEAL